MWKYFFTCGHLKKMSNQRHVCELLSWMGEGGILEKKNYEDANQIGNDI